LDKRERDRESFTGKSISLEVYQREKTMTTWLKKQTPTYLLLCLAEREREREREGKTPCKCMIRKGKSHDDSVKIKQIMQSEKVEIERDK
jgi:hypothetical protein